MTFACLRCSDKSYSIQVLSKSSMWEHIFDVTQIWKETPLIGKSWNNIFNKSVCIKIYLPTHKRVAYIDISWPLLSPIRSLDTKLNFSKIIINCTLIEFWKSIVFQGWYKSNYLKSKLSVCILDCTEQSLKTRFYLLPTTYNKL